MSEKFTQSPEITEQADQEQRELGRKLIHETTVYINAGGQGTRLLPGIREGVISVSPQAIEVHSDEPEKDRVYKGMLEFDGIPVPLVKMHVEYVRDAGFPNVLVAAGDHEIVAKTLEGYDPEHIQTLVVKKQLDTGGELLAALELCPGKYILIQNVDSLVDINYEELLTAHAKTGKAATIVLTELPDVPNQGAFFVDGNNRVMFSREGAAKDSIEPELASDGYQGSSTGVVIFNKDALLQLAQQEKFQGRSSIYRDILPWLIAQGQLAAYNNELHDFVDVGTPENYKKRMMDWREVTE